MQFGEPHPYPERGSYTDGASRGNKVIKGDRVKYIYIINIQRDATISSLYFILLQYPSTCFGCLLHPSSGVHETVVTATGTGHVSR
jgi:hypothetical protein